jgi:hypothetical protein
MDPTPDLDTLAATRLALQSVAEHVLSAARHAATGRIGLRPVPGGFCHAGLASEHGPRRIAVIGTELVIGDDRGPRRAPLTTVGAAAELAGITPGAPVEVYTPSTPLDPAAPLAVDAAAAAYLAGWFALVDAALTSLARGLADDAPATGSSSVAEAQLWPEHFDLAVTVRVNYGGSPGDEGHPRRTSTWDRTPRPRSTAGSERTARSSRPVTEVADAGAALAYLRDGHHRLADLP